MKNLDKELFKAVILNEIKEVKRLIEAGANVNVVDKDGETALLWASFWRCSNVVKILIEAGADVNAVDNFRYTALHFASLWGRREIVKMLIEAGAKQ